MQKQRVYAGDYAPVKHGMGRNSRQRCRIVCRVVCREGTLRLIGTLAELIDWMRGQCPGGKIAELAGLAGLAGRGWQAHDDGRQPHGLPVLRLWHSYGSVRWAQKPL